VGAEVANTEGRLDVLVNNAAAFVDWTEAASSADLDAARAVMETNLFGPWRMVQALLPRLRQAPTPAWSTLPTAPARTAMSSLASPAAAEVRAAMGLAPGDRLHLHLAGPRLVLERQEDAVAELRLLASDVPKSRSFVEELLAERRLAAATE